MTIQTRARLEWLKATCPICGREKETQTELDAREIPTPTERHWWQRGYDAGIIAERKRTLDEAGLNEEALIQ